MSRVGSTHLFSLAMNENTPILSSDNNRMAHVNSWPCS